MTRLLTGILATLPLAACLAPPDRPAGPEPVRVAPLGAARHDAVAFERLARAFERSNPGYRLAYRRLGAMESSDGPKLLVVHGGEGLVGVQRRSTRVLREVVAGDLILLRPGQEVFTRAPVHVVELGLPVPLPPDLPTFLGQADLPPPPELAPGEWAAERLDLIAWLPHASDGLPYVFQGVNVKRLRVRDAPTHVHPVRGGYDELVLVLDAVPGAGVLWTQRGDAIAERRLTRADAATLFETARLASGALVHVPRGTVHRPLGTSTVLVLAIPGFVPGAEVRLDDDLRALNAELGLEGDAALPVFTPPGS